MSAISLLADEQVGTHVAATFDKARAAMGKVPNLFRVMANAPAVLDIYTGAKASLGAGAIDPKIQEQIAIAIAAANGCDYCLAAHSGAARFAGVSAEDRAAAQRGAASDPHAAAVLTLALAVNANHGQGSAEAVDRARAAGLSDAEILETVAHVAVSILTNSINNLVGTPIDFPRVERVTA